MAEGKLAQVLKIEPPRDLVFQGPFTDVVTAQMVLKNPTDKSVCFKVKTTAPKQYCVRPNSGVIDANDEKQVTVMLQPLDGVPTDATRHKFMVQSCYAPGGEVDLENIWKKINPAEMMYSKLMVVFENKSGNGTHVAREEGVAAVQYSSPLSTTPSRVTAGSSAVGSADNLEEKLHREMEKSARVEKEKGALRKDLDELVKKYTKLQQQEDQRAGGLMSETGIPMIQVVLISIAALLIGLIVGKLF